MIIVGGPRRVAVLEDEPTASFVAGQVAIESVKAAYILRRPGEGGLNLVDRLVRFGVN